MRLSDREKEGIRKEGRKKILLFIFLLIFIVMPL